MKRLIVCVALLTLVAVPLAQAQEGPGPISWLAFDTSVSGKSRDMIGMTIKYDGPMYDELLENGTLESWGIAIPINHRLDDNWNFVLWATMADWGKVGELQAGFEKLFASRTPEQMMAMQKAYKEVSVEGAHHDWIVRHEVIRQGTGEQAPRYFDIGYYSAKPGMEEALTAFYKANVAPIYEKLLTDGVITGYGMYTQELHGEPGWTHVGWMTVADLGAKDTADRFFMANMTDAQMAEAAKLMDWSTHKDQVLLIVHLGGTSPEEYEK